MNAINSDEKLKRKSIEVFGQGSYANNTNVRLNSDIDINVKFTGGFYYDLPINKAREELGITPINYTFPEFKNDVEYALVQKFGRSDVKRRDKCIIISGNSYRIETDVVPTWDYRRYSDSGNYDLGTKFFTDNGFIGIVNFPKQHIENGISKNTLTYRNFKRLTRLHRKIRYKMIEDGEVVSENITSFLLECLIWNVPNSVIVKGSTWTETIKDSIIHLYNMTKSFETCKGWGEVSELLYLFHSGRKWSYQDVNQYMIQIWNYLEYD